MNVCHEAKAINKLRSHFSKSQFCIKKLIMVHWIILGIDKKVILKISKNAYKVLSCQTPLLPSFPCRYLWLNNPPENPPASAVATIPLFPKEWKRRQGINCIKNWMNPYEGHDKANNINLDSMLLPRPPCSWSTAECTIISVRQSWSNV